MNWKPRKKAIRIERLYDNVQMNTEYVIKSAKVLEDTLEHAKNHTEQYKRSRQSKDHLDGPTKLTITDITDEQVPGNLTVPVVAVMYFTYETPHHLQKSNKLSWFFMILAFLTAIFLFNALFFHDLARANEQRNMCKIYYKHGVATHIEYGSRVIDIYALTEEDILTMNPWEKEKFDLTKVDDCLQIYTEE